MEYYAAVKSNDILTHAAACMNFENTMLSKRNQMQKSTYWVILFIWDVHRIGKYTERK